MILKKRYNLNEKYILILVVKINSGKKITLPQKVRSKM